MAFDWYHYFTLAVDMYDNQKTGCPCKTRALRAGLPNCDCAIDKCGREAVLRCAASRAYYAAFGYARAYATARGWLPSSTSRDHADLREYLRKHGYKSVANHLNSARIMRNTCDYDNADIASLGSAVGNSLNEARQVFRKLP